MGEPSTVEQPEVDPSIGEPIVTEQLAVERRTHERPRRDAA